MREPTGHSETELFAAAGTRVRYHGALTHPSPLTRTLNVNRHPHPNPNPNPNPKQVRTCDREWQPLRKNVLRNEEGE